MAWVYNDYVSLSDATARLAQLRLHIQEVSATVGLTVASDGTSVDSRVTKDYLSDLKAEERRLVSAADGITRSSPMFARGVVKGLR